MYLKDLKIFLTQLLKNLESTDGNPAADADVCGGCEVCIELCPFGAIERIDEQAHVNIALCKGCGTCVAACPSGALEQAHFKTAQIMAQIEAAMGGTGASK